MEVIKIIDKKLKKEELEKIILCDVQNEIYPGLEKIFLSVIVSEPIHSTVVEIIFLLIIW